MSVRPFWAAMNHGVAPSKTLGGARGVAGLTSQSHTFVPFRTQGIASSERSGCRIVRPPKEGNPDYAGLRTRPHGVLHANRAQAGATGLSQEELVTGPPKLPSWSLAGQRELRTTSVRRP